VQLSLFEINLLIGKHCCFQPPQAGVRHLFVQVSRWLPLRRNRGHRTVLQDLPSNLCYMPWRLGWFFKVLVDLLLLFSVLLLYLLSLWLELRMFDTFLELDNASLCWFLLYGDCMVLSYIVAGRSIWGQGQCNLCQNYTYLTPDQTCRALRGFWWGNDLKFQTK